MRSNRITVRFSLSIEYFLRRILDLFTQPIFLALTLFGNLTIFTSAFVVYWLEYGKNPQINSLLDTIWWAISTVTTVGYGDVIPISPAGRIVGIITMIIGTALFWSYTALFAEALLYKEISELEGDLKDIQKLLSEFRQPNLQDKDGTKKLIEDLEKKVQNLKKLMS